MNSILEEKSGAQTTATAAKPKKEARVAPRGGHVAPRKGKAPRSKAGRTKKASKAGKKPTASRERTKTAKILDLLKQQGGVTLAELIRSTEWQAHSIRGFLSGTVGKKMGLQILSIKGEDGERTYSIKA